MAQDPKLEIQVDANSAVEASHHLDQFSDSLENVDTQSKKVKTSSKSAFDQFKDLAVGFNQAAELAGRLYEGLKEVTQEMGRQSGIMNNLAGSVDEASRRINGLVSNIELMEARNKIAAAGIQVTEHQFANLSVAAQHYAEMTGGTATEAMDKFTEAIQTGSLEQLGKLGIRITDTSSKARIQEQALQQLEQRFGTTSAQITNTRQAFDAMKVASENAFTSFTEGMNITANWSRTINELKTAASSVAQAFGVNLAENFDLAKAAGTGFGLMLQTTLRILAQATNALGLFMQGKLAEATQAFRQIDLMATATQVAGEARGNELAQGVISQVSQATAHPAASAASTSSGSAAAQTQQKSLNDLLTQSWQTQNDIVTQLAQQNQERQTAVTLAEAQANADKQHASELAQMNAATLEAEQQIAEARAAADQAQQEAQEKAVQTQDLINKGMQGMANLAQSIGTTMRQTALENKKHQEAAKHLTGEAQKAELKQVVSRKQAFKEALKEWLKGFAIQQAFQGAASLAAGIGMTITNPPGAATKYIEAAEHFALAAAAGGAAAGLAKSSKGSAPSSSSSSQTNPTSGPSDNSGGGGAAAPTVVVNVQGLPLLTDGQIGREVSNALTSYNIRYGSTS